MCGGTHRWARGRLNTFMGVSSGCPLADHLLCQILSLWVCLSVLPHVHACLLANVDSSTEVCGSVDITYCGLTCPPFDPCWSSSALVELERAP